MKRYVYPLSAVMLLALSACGPEALEEATQTAEQEPVGEASQASLVLTPVLTPVYMPVAQVYQPPQPALLDLSSVRAWPTRFFPSTVKSAYTVYYTFPTIPSTFYAFGFDVKSYKAVFVVRGQVTQKTAFKSAIDDDLQALAYEASMGMNTGYEDGRQVDVPPPPSPTPNINDLGVSAWDTSKDYYMADVAQPLVYMPSSVVYLQP
ncbi:hypothetical protein [Archangium lansingense]|uniref:Lipoprotein n=1 Tax=Archangium lansingense TaxID=2995310 RepID=A0ABT3ZYQ7_9BACT|nr:hypothetical protein [Archangium lansinium]MCY1074549.1 hypothetical protein [Archangium lansinium]